MVERQHADPGRWMRVTRIHRWLYRRTGGRIGANLGGRKILLLTTTGRKTGEPRTLPLVFLPDRDRYVVVASNGGAERDPLWWSNLERLPWADVQVGKQTTRVEAKRASGAERARLWAELVRYNPPFGKYQQRTSREIPVVVLSPQSEPE